jgi:hypothetical protein
MFLRGSQDPSGSPNGACRLKYLRDDTRFRVKAASARDCRTKEGIAELDILDLVSGLAHGVAVLTPEGKVVCCFKHGRFSEVFRGQVPWKGLPNGDTLGVSMGIYVW